MKNEDFRNYVQINKLHWDAIATRDWHKKIEELRQVKEDASYIEKWEPKIASYLNEIAGKKIIVPQFGDGHLMLACAKKGAIVTGVDLSSEQVRLARKAAAYCGVKVDLVEADWQDLPKSVPDSCFDLVVTECGIFMWIQNLDTWMKNAHRVLKVGGKLIVSDFHPISVIAEWKDGRLTFRRSYFDQRPEFCESEGNVPPSIEFRWKLSDIVNAAIRAGFKVDRLEEYYVVEKIKLCPFIPTDFLLVATKC